MKTALGTFTLSVMDHALVKETVAIPFASRSLAISPTD